MNKDTTELLLAIANVIGAVGGVLAIVLGFLALVWDRSRLLIRVRRRPKDDFSESELSFGEGFLGGVEHYYMLELLNAGRRRALVYAPEILYAAKTLTLYAGPTFVTDNGKWVRTGYTRFTTFPLDEAETISFLIPFGGEEDTPLRAEVYNTRGRLKVKNLHPFATFYGIYSFVRNRRSWKQWRQWRNWASGEQRSRHRE